MKSILIVGGSSSIGLPIIEKLNALPAKILATYHQHDNILPAENRISAPLDLTDRSSLYQFVEKTLTPFGTVDMAIFLSGILPGMALSEYEDHEIDQTLQINFSGQAKLIQRLIPFMNEGSQILMVSSISAQKGSFDPIYAASKGAILAFVKSLATSLAPKIRVNALAPGLIEDSKMFDEFTEERKTFHIAQTPMKCLLQREDLARIICDLSQDHWAHLNGACIDLNGGQYVR